MRPRLRPTPLPREGLSYEPSWFDPQLGYTRKHWKERRHGVTSATNDLTAEAGRCSARRSERRLGWPTFRPIEAEFVMSPYLHPHAPYEDQHSTLTNPRHCSLRASSGSGTGRGLQGPAVFFRLRQNG